VSHSKPGMLSEQIESHSVDAFLGELEARFTASNKRFKDVQSYLSASLEKHQVEESDSKEVDYSVNTACTSTACKSTPQFVTFH